MLILMSNFPATSPSSSSHLRMILRQSLSPVCLQPHDHVYCSIDDMITLDVHYPTVVELHRFYSHCQPRVRTTCPSIAHVISLITSNELLLQYCHVSVCIPFGLTFQLHSQTICFTTSPFSPHYLHKGDSRGLVNMVSVTWLVLTACSWAAQISASVWIFQSAFLNLLQVSLTCVVPGISLKN